MCKIHWIGKTSILVHFTQQITQVWVSAYQQIIWWKNILFCIQDQRPNNTCRDRSIHMVPHPFFGPLEAPLFDSFCVFVPLIWLNRMNHILSPYLDSYQDVNSISIGGFHSYHYPTFTYMLHLFLVLWFADSSWTANHITSNCFCLISPGS